MRHPRIVATLCVVCLAILALIPGLSTTPRPGGAVQPFDPIQIGGVDALNASTPTYTQMAKQAGVYWLRDKLYWSAIARSDGRYDWRDYDTRFADNAAQGMHTIATLDWLTGGKPIADQGSLTYFDPTNLARKARLLDFVRAFAARYNGIVDVLEVFNEPDTVHEWAEHPDEYALLLADIYQIVKSLAPQMAVINGGVAYSGCIVKSSPVIGCQFAPALLAAIERNGRPAFDAWNFHYYPGAESLTEKARRMRELLAEHGFSQPLVVTETGISSDPDPQAQAAYLNAIYREALLLSGRDTRLSLLCWYTLRDIDYQNPTYDMLRYYGLIDDRLEGKPAYAALQQLMRTAGTLHWPNEVHPTGPEPPGVSGW